MKELKVEDLMTTDVVYVEVPGSRRDVLKLMRERGVTGMPVVKKGTKKLIGMVTRTDLVSKPSEDQVALIMSRDPITVSPGDSVLKAAKLLLENNIRRLPVVEGEDLVGIITVADIVYKALADSAITDPISEYMERKMLAVWEGTPLPVVLSIMKMAKAQAVLVLDNKSELCGIITDADLVKLSEVVLKEKVSSSGIVSEGQEWDWDVSTMIYISKGELSLPDKPVSEVMTRRLITALEFTPINECAKRMRRYDIDQLPVVNSDGKVVGMVYDYALLRRLSKEPL
ncbi:MAG: inosine-5-monophosphate dehydrogenase [Thermoprotei archaeon]|nr:MAG: inosine-5-monophosphate dehydrogenase [Thermoprotei archaeon]